MTRTNEERAGRARVALDAYAHTLENPEGIEPTELARDLLTDLFHHLETDLEHEHAAILLEDLQVALDIFKGYASEPQVGHNCMIAAA